ncbi:MAG: hypothetical protein ACEQSM_02235 [Aliarcobacter sp.]
MAIGVAGLWAQSSPISELKYVTVADLRSQPPPTRPCYAEVQGYSWPGDGGGGFFFWDGKCTEADEGGAYFKAEGADEGRWFRIFAGKRASVLMWGARGDGKTDDAPAIQRALDFVSKAGFTLLEFPPATYALNRWIEPAGNAAWKYTHLALGRQAGPPVQLTMRGPGATLLSVANGPEVNSSRNTILQIYENIKEFRAEGLTFERRMEPGSGNFRQGVNVTDNTGQGNLLQEIPTHLIGFYDCTFIDCHRALTVGRGLLHQGIDQLDVVGCRFLYPRASNSTRQDGGGQVAFAGCDVENLNCINSYAEGSDESGVNSPNGLPKDGFWFGTGRRTLIDGCTLKRFWVEGIYVLDPEPGLYVEKVVIPEVGEVVEIPIARGTDPKLVELFSIGTAVYLNKRNGYYKVEKTGSFSLTLRRLAQPSPMVPGPKGGEEAKGIFCKRTGTTDDISTTVTGCTFEGGPIPGMSSERDGLDPALRVDAGELILSGSTFSDSETTLMFYLDEATPSGQKGSVLSNNTFKDSGKARGGKNQISLVDIAIIGGTIAGNNFIIEKADPTPQFKCLEVGFGAGGSTVVRGNTFRVEEMVPGAKILAIWRDFREGKMVADGNVFDGVDAGAVDDPAANFEGKNIKIP